MYKHNIPQIILTIYYARIFMKSQGHIVTEPQTREIKVLFRKTKLQI